MDRYNASDSRVESITCLDLFCGPGGAATGYHRAGMDIEGIDIQVQPRYPFPYLIRDAVDYVSQHGHKYDFIHASPPCQEFTRMKRFNNWNNTHGEFIEATRAALIVTGKPYIIENVEGAPLDNPIMVCGQRVGLNIIRHRYFESNLPLKDLSCLYHLNYLVFARSPDRAYMHAMGIDWMTPREARQAIPPIYTYLLGLQVREILRTNSTATDTTTTTNSATT